MNIQSYYYLKIISSRLDKIIKLKWPIKPLTFPIQNIAGRSFGRIVSPRRSTFCRRIYRAIDFKRTLFPAELGIVLRSTYDPNRSAWISLVCFSKGVYVYILKPARLNSEDIIQNFNPIPKKAGDSSYISNFPAGILIHNISLYPHRQGQLIRSAGCSTILVRKETDHVLLKLKSGELRYFGSSVTASWGVVGNELHFLRNYKLAGVLRRLGKRPKTRPSAMNPVDHPMGGRTKGGCQQKNSRGVITFNRPTKRKRHLDILYTKRQMKFRRF